MAREKFKRTITPGSIKPGECIYGSDEMVLILLLYGKDSEIHKAMANGQAVSNMVEQSIKEHLKTLEREKILLQRCKEREELVEESRQPGNI